jgi:hypothetical protein
VTKDMLRELLRDEGAPLRCPHAYMRRKLATQTGRGGGIGTCVRQSQR